MSRERRTTLIALVLLSAGLPGCGGSSDTQQSAPVATDRPDSGMEAAKRIKDMQPPPPPPRR